MDDSTRRTLTILATFAVVLIALFVFSVGYRPGCSCGRREDWQARLLRPKPVALGQLSGCPKEPGLLKVPGTCKLTIAAADARSRRLVIKAIEPMELKRVTNADGRHIPVRGDLEPNKPTEIFVGKEGETIELSCLGGASSCSARLN
jgi:hypothetical protein